MYRVSRCPVSSSLKPFSAFHRMKTLAYVKGTSVVEIEVWTGLEG